VRCIRCGACIEACGQGAIQLVDNRICTDSERCTLCGACADACYADARQIVGQQMSVSDVMAVVLRDEAFYDESGGGVTLSGGEPLAQPLFVAALLSACKEKGIHTAVDTCGYAPWESIEAIRRDVDLFLYDLKLLDDEDHRRFTGVPNGLILDNLQTLSNLGHSIVIRVPLIPGVNDDQASLARIGAFVAGLPRPGGIGGPFGVSLLPYHAIAADKYGRLDRAYRLENAHPPSKEALAEMSDLLCTFGLTVTIGG
jgi:pyruvate formate lyase activating enzyme